MRYTWFFIIVPIAIAAIVFLAWYLHRLHSQDRDLKRVAVIAHTRTIKMLPEYRKAVRRYYILLIATAFSFLASIFTFTAVAARPTSREERDTENENRDIVLCLDVSGSMDDYQEAILSQFSRIVNGLHGQRVGLTIFDGNPANLVPLTDDYDAVIELVSELSKNFSAYYSAAANYNLGSSLIGDGVMGCINNLNSDNEVDRSKSVIIATDNYAGNETVDINQAARYAKRLGITFYGISINSYAGTRESLFQAAVTDTGGSFYNIYSSKASPSAADNIIDKILEQEAAKIAGAVEVVYTDAPDILLLIAAGCFTVFLALIWRLRL